MNEPIPTKHRMLLPNRKETYRSIYTTGGLKNPAAWNRKSLLRPGKGFAKGYLEDCIGVCIGPYNPCGILCEKGFDGIVHVFPVTCMPEIVSRQVLEKISLQKKIPIMSLALDEHMERTGVETRVEAFAELLHGKKHNVN